MKVSACCRDAVDVTVDGASCSSLEHSETSVL